VLAWVLVLGLGLVSALARAWPMASAWEMANHQFPRGPHRYYFQQMPGLLPRNPRELNNQEKLRPEQVLSTQPYPSLSSSSWEARSERREKERIHSVLRFSAFTGPSIQRWDLLICTISIASSGLPFSSFGRQLWWTTPRAQLSEST
jgi:hypothetical protein